MSQLWENKTLRDLVELQRGYDLTSSERKNGIIPVVGAGGVNGCHNSSKVSGPGVVIGRSGSGFGNAFYLDKDFWPHNTGMYVKDFKGNWPLFVFHYLDWFDFSSYNSGGAQPSLNRNFIYPISVKLPPLLEQKSIADILSTWDQAIEKTQQLIKAKEKRYRYIQDDIFSNTAKWKAITLGESGDNYNGLAGKTKNDFGHGISYIPYMNIYKNSRINTRNLELVKVGGSEKQNKVKKGDVFFTTSSETPNEVGVSSVLLDDLDECYLNSFCFAWRPHDKMFIHEYLQFYFRCKIFRTQMRSLAQGATRFNLAKSNLMKSTLYYPDEKKQLAIVDKLTTAQQEIVILRKLLNQYQTQKRGLMQRLLTGEWRVV